jgi:menaquinone-dependent protoporphyrinogen oxidase
MSTKVLVAYATKYGATAEIAEKIGEVLNQDGVPAEVLPVSQVKGLEPSGADRGLAIPQIAPAPNR